MTINRRVVLGGIVGVGSVTLASARAGAAAPPYGRQVIGAYRHVVGKYRSDRPERWRDRSSSRMFPAADPAEANKILIGRSLPRDKSPTAVNAFIINTGDKLVLVDAGSGALMGPTLGRFASNLAALGINPASIDIVAMTHLHPDHFGGLLTSDRKIAFPNAQFVVSETDTKFWLDEGIAAQAPPVAKPFFDMARATIPPYISGGNVRFIANGQECTPGVTAHSAPGHTPGHTMYRVTSGGDTLLIWGDIIHSYALQFAHPEWGVAFDVDPAGAIATRLKVFDMAVADGLVIAGAHVPFPGIGHVVRAGNAYSFDPLFWRPS